nr:MAG TPA_asm: Monocytic leukemia zinc finger protein finger, acetyl transferase, DNA [Caudoviricetes sp.]
MKDHDGCAGCVYESKSEREYPCCECKQSYIDKWRSKDMMMECNKVVTESEDFETVVDLAKSLTELIIMANENINGINQDLFRGGRDPLKTDGIDCLMDQMRWNVNSMNDLLNQIDALKRVLI